MQTESNELTLFVRDPASGRIVFNSKAIEALGLRPAELAQRGYPLDRRIPSPTIAPDDELISGSANG